jgi:FKBP-type peptidyl-prolyl cis-trans isomerase FkpA
MRFLPIILLFTTLISQTTASPITNFGHSTGDSLTLDKYITAQNIKAERTPEGLFFTVHTEGVGKEPQQGDYVKIRYVGKLLSGKIFDESPKNEPFAFQVGKQQVIEGWDIALQKLKIGSKITLYVPAKFGYGAAGIGDVIPPNTPLMYDIELLDILSPTQYQAHLQSVENAEKRVFMERIAEQLLTDQRAIADYALLHRLKTKRTESGINYVITKEGKGERAKAGNQITLNYDGYFLNDRVFDSTKDREPLTFKLDEGNLILGFEEGLQQFSEGSEGYLLIPSKFGYGSTPYDDGKIIIGGNSVLIYKIKILAIK